MQFKKKQKRRNRWNRKDLRHQRGLRERSKITKTGVGDIMDTEEGAGLGAEDSAPWCRQVSWIVISEAGEKVEKDPEMLKWRERKVSTLTEMSVMLRRGKWRQEEVGGLWENGKCLEHEEFDWQSARGPKHKLPSIVHTGPTAYITSASPLPVGSLLLFKPQDQSHCLSEIFLGSPSQAQPFSLIITFM